MTPSSLPELELCAQRLRAIGKGLDAAMDMTLFRFINPRYAKAGDIVSGAGALRADGRWNIKGTARLSYTATTPETALAETLAHAQYYQLPLASALPRVLVGLRLKIIRGLDLREPHVGGLLKLSESTMRKTDWRAVNQKGGVAVTQSWGAAFAQAGFEAVAVPSAAAAEGVNILVFPENLLPGNSFEVLEEIVWPS